MRRYNEKYIEDRKRHMGMWRVLAVSIFCMISFAGHGQNDPIYTMAWAMPTLYNPAEAGATDWLRIRGAGRMQWIGIENAPKSFTATGDIPFKLAGKRWGGGANLTTESLGLFSNTYVNGQLAGRMKLFGQQFSVGLQIGYYSSKFRGSDVYIPSDDDYHESTDPSIPNQDVGGGTIDFGLGLTYLHPKFHVGISAMHLSSPTVKFNTQGTTGSSATSDNHEFETGLERTFYLQGGSNIPIKNTLFILQPDLLLATDLKTLSGIVSLKAEYNRFLYAGLAYRWNDAIAINVGAEIKNFVVGYSYDIPTSKILKASSGSHEIMVGYRLKLDFSGKNRNRHRSIRLM